MRFSFSKSEENYFFFRDFECLQTDVTGAQPHRRFTNRPAFRFSPNERLQLQRSSLNPFPSLSFQTFPIVFRNSIQNQNLKQIQRNFLAATTSSRLEIKMLSSSDFWRQLDGCQVLRRFVKRLDGRSIDITRLKSQGHPVVVVRECN